MGCRPRPVPCPPTTGLLNSPSAPRSVYPVCYSPHLSRPPPRLAVPPRNDVQGNYYKCIASSSLLGLPCTSDTMHATLPSFVIYLCADRRCLCARLPCPELKSNGFATCKTGEIIDAQVCLAKPRRWKGKKKNCQRRSSVPWSLGRGPEQDGQAQKPGHHKHPTALSHASAASPSTHVTLPVSI